MSIICPYRSCLPHNSVAQLPVRCPIRRRPAPDRDSFRRASASPRCRAPSCSPAPWPRPGPACDPASVRATSPLALLSSVVVVPHSVISVLEDANGIDRHKPAGHQLIEDGEKRIDLLCAVDDLDDEGKTHCPILEFEKLPSSTVCLHLSSCSPLPYDRAAASTRRW